MYPTKQFTNNAPQPIFVSVTAHIDDRGFVTSTYAAGGTFGLSETQRAEAHRMLRWIRATFVGQTERFFNAHNGIVPHEETPLPDVAARFFNTSGSANPLNLDQRDRRFAALDTEQLELRIMAADLPESAYRIPMSALKPEPEVGHEGFAAAPNVGTYWQCRERPVRFFFLISKHECEGHTHMRMLRVDHARGGEYDFIYENDAQWNQSFKRVAQVDVPGNTVAGRTVVLMDRGTCKVSFDGGDAFPASEMTDDQLSTVVAEHGEAHPGLRDFLEEQRPQRRIEFPARVPLSSLKTREFSPEEARKQVDAYRAAFPLRFPFGDEPDAYAKLAEDYGSVQYRSALDGVPKYMQQFLDALDFNGNEVPPAVGERYFSWISGSVYRVVDASRKLHREDYYVTMEREHDGHKAKFTFRDHATWLSVWRPVDPEGNARPVEMVDVPTTTIDLTVVDDAGSAMAKLGTAAHEAAEAVMDFRETDAERQLRVIYRELDRKVPGWREAGDGDHVFLDDTALALRAIRSINKHMNAYKGFAETSSDELRNLSAAFLKLNGEKSRVEREMREVIAERRGGWSAERAVRAEDTMREMVRLYTLLFARAYGKGAAKHALSAFNATTLPSLPPELRVGFMAHCEEYSRRRHEG